MITKTYVSNSVDETIEIGKNFGSNLSCGNIVSLIGNLGSGKTKFVQGISKFFDIKEIVSSPTFTLINEYNGNLCKIIHFDLYRLKSTEEILELGFIDYLNDKNSICIIEWGEKSNEILPKEKINVNFEYGKNEFERIITIEKIYDTRN